MSLKDTVMDKCQKNNTQKEGTSKSSLLLFNFSHLKKSARLSLSEYNLFNYNFDTKELFELNQKKEPFYKKESEYINETINLNSMKNINIDIPSSEKLFQEKFCKEFLENYETSFANFCEIDKNQYIKAFINKKYIPQLDKFGDIKISVKNLLDILKNYSQFLKLKIKRRFIKKYKKKKLFKTMKNDGLNYLNSKDGLKLLSLKKNLKISVKKNNNANSIDKENSQEENINYNSNNNNFLNNINNLLNNDIFSNSILKSSIFNFQPPSNNPIPSSENFFSFSIQDQNIFNFNNVNNMNQIQTTNNQNNQFLNKKRTFTPYVPFTPFYNNNNNPNPNANQSNKKNNQPNLNIQTPLYNYNSLISPQIFSSYKDLLTPSSIQFSQGDIPFLPNDKFNFSNLRSPFVYGNLNAQSPIINNNIFINPNYLNINNNGNNNIKENNNNAN